MHQPSTRFYYISAAFPKHSDDQFHFRTRPVESQSLLMPTCERCLHFSERKECLNKSSDVENLRLKSGNGFDIGFYRGGPAAVVN